jgi:dolichol kinase
MPPDGSGERRGKGMKARMKHLGRKLFHLFGGLGLLSIYYVFPGKAFLIYGILIFAVFAVEIARLKSPAMNKLLFGKFPSFIRKSEEHSLTGTIPYILGVGLSFYVYSAPTATAAVCFLAFGDVAATTIGERFGKTKIRDKSLEGTAAFIVAAVAAGCALLIFFPTYPFWVMLLGALSAAGIELLSLAVNDNFAIPIIAGAVMAFALRFA